MAAILTLGGCASQQYPDIDEPMPPGAMAAANRLPSPNSPASGAAPVVASMGSLQRADVERVVDAGLGRFLSHVAIEPSLEAGKFAGWSIVALQPPELWRGIDLRPGDVVTRVNGMTIEREVEAYDAFQAVRQASALEISYLRQGQRRTLRFPILGAPSIPPREPSRDKGPRDNGPQLQQEKGPKPPPLPAPKPAASGPLPAGG